MSASSRLVRWLHGSRDVTWGGDPGAFDAEATLHTVEAAGRWFGPGRYFGLDARGWENLPAAPTLVVSNHSGGTTIPDAWGFGIAWYRRFGGSRPIHPLAHEIIMSTRLTGEFFGKRGVLRADKELAHEVLTRWRRDVLVMPGGDVDTWRPFRKRWQVCFGGRTGYARLALRAGVPIVPVANAGAHETLVVLTDGRRFARWLGLPKLARASIFPVSLSLPWGVAVGPLPHLPTPTTLRYRFGPPVLPPERVKPGAEPSDALVREYDRLVREAIQLQLDGLRAEAEARRTRLVPELVPAIADGWVL